MDFFDLEDLVVDVSVEVSLEAFFFFDVDFAVVSLWSVD